MAIQFGTQTYAAKQKQQELNEQNTKTDNDKIWALREDHENKRKIARKEADNAMNKAEAALKEKDNTQQGSLHNDLKNKIKQLSKDKERISK